MGQHFTKQQLEDQYTEVEMIQEELFDICRRLEQIIREREDENARRYILSHLQIITSSDHVWISHDPNLDHLKQRIRDDADELEGTDANTAAIDDETMAHETSEASE